MRRFLALLVVFAVLAAACSGGDDPESRTPDRDRDGSGDQTATTSDPGSSPTRTTSATGRADLGDFAEVGPLDCVDLLRQDEIDEALAVWDRPDGQQDSRGSIGGEYCSEWLVSDDRVFVGIEPGDPADFEGAELLGVAGEPVDDIGDAAVWFGGPRAEGGGESGVLSVRRATSVGDLFFRIRLGRPDLSVAEQIEVAGTLAARALPRFPGLEAAAAAVPIVGLCGLIPADEAEAILAAYRDVHPATMDEVLVGGPANPVDLRDEGDAKCNWLILAEIYIEVQQGAGDDFAAGAQKEGVAGEPVAGIGDEAVWFAGVPFQGRFTAPHEQGILSVRYRDARFRVVLALPDTPWMDQLEIARGLALGALSRLPGYEPPAAEFDDTPEDGVEDASDMTLVDNLLAREANGDWDRGRGLVATLRMLTGEAGSAGVLVHDEVLESEATGIIAMAYEYLDDSADAQSRAEIERLLGLLVFSNEELEAMAGIAAEGDPVAAPARAVRVSFPLAQTPADMSVDGCSRFFNPDVYQTTPGVGPCLEWRPAEISSELAGKYRLFVPAPSWPQAGWTKDHFDLALQALEWSAARFETDIVPVARAAGAPGRMPPVNVVFSVAQPKKDLLAHTKPVPGRPCGVALFPLLQTESKKKFEQTIAHELAHCFQTENFPDQNKVDYEFVKWREEGLAEYLSNVVYPDYNTEHDWTEETRRLGRRVTLQDLSYGNFLFFQYLEKEVGLQGIFSLVGTLPTSGGRRSQWEALSQYPRMSELFHGYIEDSIDGVIDDTGGGHVPYNMVYRTRVVPFPFTFDKFIVPFGVYRIKLEVPDCKIARTTGNWGDAEHSARPEAVKTWADLPSEIPSSSAGPRQRVLAISAVDQADVTFGVSELKHDPECGEEPSSEAPDLPPLCAACGPSEYYRKSS